MYSGFGSTDNSLPEVVKHGRIDRHCSGLKLLLSPSLSASLDLLLLSHM